MKGMVSASKSLLVTLFALFLGLLLILSVAATADMNNWQIKCGLTGNTYPYGSDYGTRFGVNSIGTFKFDGQDSVHPAPGDPFSDLEFVYKPYESAYTHDGYTWATGGYLTRTSDGYVDTKHGPGLPSANWFATGVMKDTRPPLTDNGVPERWLVSVAAPLVDDSDGIHFEWSIGQERGLEVPDNVYAKILSNPDLVAAGYTGDLMLTGHGAGTFDTRSFPQFGVNVDPDTGDPIAPIFHTWIIEAGVVTEVQAPDGWLNPGWNYFSIPLDPADGSDASSLLGFNCDNIVYRWNPVTKNIELCPNDFTDLARGRGYLMWLWTTPPAPSYEACPPTGSFEIALPEAGWTWIGQPFDHDTLLSTCSIRNNTTGFTRTAMEDQMAVDPWINWNFVWWDSQAGGSNGTWDIVWLGSATNNSLLPWHAYLVWANTRNLTLIVPPE